MPLHYSIWTRIASAVLEGAARLCLCPFGKKKGGGPVRRILLVEPFGMGDVLSLSVMIDPLKAAYPESEIRLLTKRGNEGIYAKDPRIQTVYSMPVPWSKISGQKRGTLSEWLDMLSTCRAVAGWTPDVGMDTRGEIRSQILMVLCGCGRRVGFTNYLNTNMNVRGWLLTDAVEKPDVLNRYVMNCRLVERGLGVGAAPVVFPSFRPQIAAEMTAGGKAQILIHIGARWFYRQWPVERWVELARGLVSDEVSIVVAGAGEEAAAVSQIAEAVPGVVAVCADLERLIGLVRGSDLVVCLDSGPMHLAQTLGIPVVALFGPGDFELWSPQGARDESVFHRLPCNPCLQKTCVRPEDCCMMRISVAEVRAAVDRVFDSVLRKADG